VFPCGTGGVFGIVLHNSIGGVVGVFTDGIVLHNSIGGVVGVFTDASLSFS